MTTYDEIDALNWSTLKEMAISAKMLRHRRSEPREDTKSLRQGRYIHCAILERDRWLSEFVAEPDFDLGPKPRKPASNARPATVDRYEAAMADWEAPRKAWEADNIGKTIVAADEHALAERCADAIAGHQAAADILRGVKCEQIVTWADPSTGIACKARLDAIAPTYIVDLKSTRRSSLRRIYADCAEYLYHGQIAWYHDGATEAGALPQSAAWPYLITVQTVEPHDVVVMQADTFVIQAGRSLCNSLLRKYAGCVAADMWPGVAPGVVPWHLPPWAQSGGTYEEVDW